MRKVRTNSIIDTANKPLRPSTFQTLLVVSSYLGGSNSTVSNSSYSILPVRKSLFSSKMYPIICIILFALGWAMTGLRVSCSRNYRYDVHRGHGTERWPSVKCHDVFDKHALHWEAVVSTQRIIFSPCWSLEKRSQTKSVTSYNLLLANKNKRALGCTCVIV